MENKLNNTLDDLTKNIVPEQTILFFGAGSSIPSGAPSVEKIISKLKEKYGIDGDYTLTELTGLIEITHDRKSLITFLRSLFVGINPTRGIVNLPLYKWKSIFTTNYDTLIEESYKAADIKLKVVTSNFDFSGSTTNYDTIKLFKVHGTIEKDICDGDTSRIIISDQDYDSTDDYRQQLWRRLEADIGESHLIIIGYSLSDPHIKNIIDRAISSNVGATKISLVLYSHDENRAKLYERRGIKVYFGGIDEFFFSLARQCEPVSCEKNHDYLASTPELRPITLNISHAIERESNFSAMFNGWPASYSDISNGFTFDRSIADDICNYLVNGEKIVSIILGAGGVGKSTLARKILTKFFNKDYVCWEHQTDHPLLSESWCKVAKLLLEEDKYGILLIDEAHYHIRDLGLLVDKLASENIKNLKLVVVSSRNLWEPRIKPINLYKHGEEHRISKLNSLEVDSLIYLIETNPQIRMLAERSFSGFSRAEKKRRLLDRCDSDMFVCLKNIFASEKFDDIILREYAQLDVQLQDIYKIVSAMEFSGIKVHRQLIVRLLGIPARMISGLLDQLSEIIVEYHINDREGVYGWKTRHHVIAGIIAKYKYGSSDQFVELFKLVLENISPTYDIEIRSIRELCNIESGIMSIPDKNIQNELLRQMISIAPGERIPRHRLIRNLIDSEEYEKAETEIRIFENDFSGKDGTVQRYKISLLYSRAMQSQGILLEDRKAILDEALGLAKIAITKFPTHKYILSTYAELGLCYIMLINNHEIFKDALVLLKEAEPNDPDISSMILKFQRQVEKLYQATSE